MIKIYTIFTQQDTNSVQVPIDYKPGNTGTKTRNLIKQGAKISWSTGIEIIESVLLSLWNYVRNQCQKIVENYPTCFQMQFDIYLEKSLI